MHPERDETTELLALPYEAGEEGATRERRVDRRKRRVRGRRAAVLSSIGPLLVVSAVAAMAATATGPFDTSSGGRIVTASVVAPRQVEPSPETEPSVEPGTPSPAESVTVAPPAPAPPPVPEPYTVAAGDTMATLEAHCATPWRRLFDANPDIADPDVLPTGMLVRCPAPDEQLAERALPTPTPEPPPTQNEEDDDDDAPAPEPAPEEPVGDAGVWDDLAECESGGNWSINTGNGYYGGLQFSLSSWRAVGGSGYPHENSKAEQINRGERLQDAQGWGAWPTCARKLGLT